MILNDFQYLKYFPLRCVPKPHADIQGNTMYCSHF